MGSPNQQDAEIASLFNEAILNYGNGRVLGILATYNDDHSIEKRDVDLSSTLSPSTTPSSFSTTPSPEENTNNTNTTDNNCDDCVYYKEGKAILHTKFSPELEIRKEIINGTNNRTEWITNTTILKGYNLITYDSIPSRPYDIFTIIFLVTDKNKQTEKVSQRITYSECSLIL